MRATQGALDNPATTHAVVKLLTESTTAPRLAMRGTSMLPLLREPMVLQLGPSDQADRIGDLLVFERAGQLVAHRITSLRNGQLQTCGDALPWSPEYPARSAIIGKVIAVWTDDSDQAQRVDTTSFKFRGMLKAHFRAARALPFRAKALARRLASALYRRTFRKISSTRIGEDTK